MIPETPVMVTSVLFALIVPFNLNAVVPAATPVTVTPPTPSRLLSTFTSVRITLPDTLLTSRLPSATIDDPVAIVKFLALVTTRLPGCPPP